LLLHGGTPETISFLEQCEVSLGQKMVSELFKKFFTETLFGVCPSKGFGYFGEGFCRWKITWLTVLKIVRKWRLGDAFTSLETAKKWSEKATIAL
jgi:hypothetical protein